MSYQTSGSLNLYLNIKSSKAPALSTFEARRKPSVTCAGPLRRERKPFWSHNFAPCCPSVPSRLRNLVRALGVWGEAEASSCKKMNCGYPSVANWFYLGTNMVQYLFKPIMCTHNGLPRYCKSHVPSRGIGAESGTVVGLGFRQSFVNADWAYENLMIEWMGITKLWKTCGFWVEILRWLYLPWKFKQYTELGLCLWGKGDKLQQNSCRYVRVFICDKI